MRYEVLSAVFWRAVLTNVTPCRLVSCRHLPIYTAYYPRILEWSFVKFRNSTIQASGPVACIKHQVQLPASSRSHRKKAAVAKLFKSNRLDGTKNVITAFTTPHHFPVTQSTPSHLALYDPFYYYYSPSPSSSSKWSFPSMLANRFCEKL